MKRVMVMVLALLAAAVVVGSSSCSKKNKVKFLIKEWSIETVKLGTKDMGLDVSGLFKGAKFNFKNDNTYTMSKGEGAEAGKVSALLPTQGKWDYDEEKGAWVKLNGVKYTIEEESDGKIHLQGPVYLVLK